MSKTLFRNSNLFCLLHNFVRMHTFGAPKKSQTPNFRPILTKPYHFVPNALRLRWVFRTTLFFEDLRYFSTIGLFSKGVFTLGLFSWRPSLAQPGSLMLAIALPPQVVRALITAKFKVLLKGSSKTNSSDKDVNGKSKVQLKCLRLRPKEPT